MKEIKYLAYINDKMFGFADVYSIDEKSDFSGMEVLSSSSNSMQEAIEDIITKKDWKGVVYLSDSPKKSWEEFVSHFTLQEAAGGLVKNELDQFLVIFRRGKWDLPKGKIDYDESPAEAALREVKEECGVKELAISEPLEITFHSYPHKGKQVLKKTHWYVMEAASDEILQPETEEDIEKVQWMSEEEIRTEFYSNTYSSVKNLLSSYFKK